MKGLTIISASPQGPVATASVPRISAFYGIVITMNWREHLPPHFHARYSGAHASIEIATGTVLEGYLPIRALRLVRDWARLHEPELSENWRRARSGLALDAVEPLP